MNFLKGVKKMDELAYFMLQTIYVKKMYGTSKISEEEYEELFSSNWVMSENYELKADILAKAINNNKKITEIDEYIQIEEPGLYFLKKTPIMEYDDTSEEELEYRQIPDVPKIDKKGPSLLDEIIEAAGKGKVEPVVGWLVCVNGDGVGKSYDLNCGRNFIGRENDMDVVLSSDKSVSRRKHAIIIYEPRKRKFYAQPGESKELFYVNDEMVKNVLELKAYDKILIGKTELMFMPFCGEIFAW